MNDDRKGLPSASNIHRLAACPGSYRLESGLPDASTPEAESGTRIHAVLAGQAAYSALSFDELEICDACSKIEQDVLAQWKLRHQIPDDAAVLIVRDAERLWLRDECSGLADVVYIHDDKALVLDFKTGRVAADDGAENLQLRCLAVLVGVNYPATQEVEVAIVQPLVSHAPEVCRYGPEELYPAELELQNILVLARATDAPLRSGDHCKFCRAASICPEVHKEVETLSALTIHENGLTVSDEDMAKLLGKCGAATKMIQSIKAECHRRAEADAATWRAYGFEIREGAGKRAVENISTVADRLEALGAPIKSITAKCTISIKSCEEIARAATGAKGMGLKKVVEGVLADCVQIKKAKPSLKKIGAGDSDEE